MGGYQCGRNYQTDGKAASAQFSRKEAQPSQMTIFAEWQKDTPNTPSCLGERDRCGPRGRTVLLAANIRRAVCRLLYGWASAPPYWAVALPYCIFNLTNTVDDRRIRMERVGLVHSTFNDLINSHPDIQKIRKHSKK